MCLIEIEIKVWVWKYTLKQFQSSSEFHIFSMPDIRKTFAPPQHDKLY